MGSQQQESKGVKKISSSDIAEFLHSILKMGAEKFCLRWNDFETNVSSAFRELRDDKDFFDVTLACDNDQIQAHKVILSACSPFFRNILRRNSHQHPLLYLKGVKYSDLQSVLNFMYHGEVNIAQEELNSFLAVAEDLSVKGLTQNHPGNSKPPQPVSKPLAARSRDLDPLPKSHNYPKPVRQQTQETAYDDIQEVVPVKSEPKEPTNNTTLQSVYGGNQEVAGDATMDQSVTAYQDDVATGYEEYEDYQYGDQDTSVPSQQQGYANVQGPEDLRQYIYKDNETKENCCALCSFRSKIPALVKNHLEGIHFPGVFTYSCELCGKTFNGRNALGVHNSKVHSKKAV